MERLLHAQNLGNKAMLELVELNSRISDAINNANDSIDATVQLAEMRHLILDLLSTMGDIGDIICDSIDKVAEMLSEMSGDDDDG